jgi:hypothetical protein
MRAAVAVAGPPDSVGHTQSPRSPTMMQKASPRFRRARGDQRRLSILDPLCSPVPGVRTPGPAQPSQFSRTFPSFLFRSTVLYFTDRGIEELESRRGEEEVSLSWVAERLREFVDLNPDFEVPVERLATWLARLDDEDEE